MNTKQGRFPYTTFFIILIVVLVSTFMSANAMDAGAQRDLLSPDVPGPEIDVWYGLTQSFGHIGTPQDQINILGNVSDPQGVKTLTFSLNSGDERTLSIGPDSRRLVNAGDFNVEIFYDDIDLVAGANSLVISATDNADNLSQVTVTVNYTDLNTWTLPYSTDWGTATLIEDEAQVVDGLWDIVAGGVRTTEPGYDRLIAIGDVDWDDYEVSVPVTINSTPGETAGLGIMLRWNGHTDDPVSGWQPKSGWIPFGAVGWYRWLDDYFDDRLQIYGNEGHILAEEINGRSLVPGTTYVFKIRVETVPGQGSLYTLKVWEQVDTEPDGWDLMGQADIGDPSNGSFLLLAHLVDATFGDVTVNELGSDTTDPVISNIEVRPGLTSAIVSWETDEPTTGRVDYGPTDSYSFGHVDDPEWGIKHSVLLTGLNTNSTYHYEISATDTSSNTGNSGDKTFKTESKASSSGIDSDDFNECSLDTGLWSFIDPVGDSSVNIMNGLSEDAWAHIGVPGGTDHDLWIKRYDAPRLMQPASNADFEIEVKFESDVDEIHQLQGILVEQSQPDQDYLRFGFYYDGTTNKTVIFAAGYIDGIPIVKNDQYINSGNPLYMRVKRQGDTWTQKYSYNGTSWTSSMTFIHPIEVTAVGTYAGNAVDPSTLLLSGTKYKDFSEDYHYPLSGGIELLGVTAGAPAHDGYMDYFFNTASPVVPEDEGRNDLTISISPPKKGTVKLTPDKDNYSCNESVQLKAEPIYGWLFSGWQGDVSGNNNPKTIIMNGYRDIIANFDTISATYFLSVVFGDWREAANT